MAAYERILDILDSEPFVKQNPNASDVGELEGEIKFENVDFSYNTDEWVFKGLNLKIEKGEKLAIVGHTGSGKTSLVSLLARYYEYINRYIYDIKRDPDTDYLKVIRYKIKNWDQIKEYNPGEK